MFNYFAIYATGWYTSDLHDVLATFGQHSKFVAFGHLVEWDCDDKRFVVRPR